MEYAGNEKLGKKELNFSIVLDTHQTKGMKATGQAREFINKIQRLRKDSGLQVADNITVVFEFVDNSPTNAALAAVLSEQLEFIQSHVKKPVVWF